jgi:hypothetical protein
VCTLGYRFLLLTLLAGCAGGDGRSTVRGHISFAGAPLESGLIGLEPVPGSDGVGAGGTIENGRYSITHKGPLPGKYKVVIRAWRKTGRMVPVPPIGPGAKAGTMTEEKVQSIPDKYNTNSELLVEIEPGRNQHDFELESD